jgi:hypothetical protein
VFAQSADAACGSTEASSRVSCHGMPLYRSTQRHAWVAALTAVVAVAVLAGTLAPNVESTAPSPSRTTALQARVTGLGRGAELFTYRCADRRCSAAALEGLSRLFARARDRHRVCPQVYGGPERLRITGRLRGRSVDVVIARSDGCGIVDYERFFELIGRAAPFTHSLPVSPPP